MSFNIVLQNAGFFKKVINAMEILEEPVIRIEPDRMYVRQMDGTHSALIYFELPKSSFLSYECDAPTMVKVNREEILKCLRKVSDSQSIGLAVDEGKGNKMFITLTEKSIKDFSVDNYVVEEKDVIPPPNIGKATSDVKIKIDASAFADSIEELKSIMTADLSTIDITASKGHLVLKGEGTKRGLTVTHILGSHILAMDIPEGITVSTFNIYILQMIVANPAALSGVLLIGYSTLKPLILTYELPFEGTLMYYLAPMRKMAGEV